MKFSEYITVRASVFLGLLTLTLLIIQIPAVRAQEGTTIPDSYRGTADAIARGVLDGNLIETNYRNHGELARWDDIPWGYWPRGVGNPRHIDGIAVVVSGLVRGIRPEPFWRTGTRDTLLNPVSFNYRGSNIGTYIGPRGDVWGWLPLPGFHNTLRRNPITGQREPVPAISSDPSSWPASWPDKLEEEDSGWPGVWNGMFGKGIFSADQESFYMMDDLSDRNYNLDPITGQPYSPYGLFYPDPTDQTKGGLGLQVGVRLLQWANILAEDTMFLIYRITNRGTTNFGECIDFGMVPPNALPPEIDEVDCPGTALKTGLFFTQFVDFGLGNDTQEIDDNAAFNPQLDVAYGWDRDFMSTDPTGAPYRLGYTGFAFLESPANAGDGLDNDEDGIIDEQRFGGPGSRIVGQSEIRAYVESRYDMILFEAKYGRLEDRPAFRAGVWWTGDENLDWVGFEDRNGNGVLDIGELVNDDYGRDGLGPYDLGYEGPDEGEADGLPTIREPNFDELDVDESDQIGLTGFHLSTRIYYQPGATTNIRYDEWLWPRIRENLFLLGQKPELLQTDAEPFINFTSGPVNLRGNGTDFFSTAWIFGWDEQEFFKNRQTVQNIYNADYRFAQPPTPPTLKAEAGDGYVVLSWDTLSIASRDRFTNCKDFEGYKLYKGTDLLLSDALTITDVNGVAKFYKPIARWDLVNGISGNVPVLENTAFYDLGSDTGLEFSYIDRDVVNGKTYYYALVAYDHGSKVSSSDPLCKIDPDPNAPQLDPQENTFNVKNLTANVAAATPRARAAGYVDAGADIVAGSQNIGTGSIHVEVVNSALLKEDAVYRIAFFDTSNAGQDVYRTVGYELRNMATSAVIIPRSPFAETTPAVDGFVVTMANADLGLDPQRTGWMGTNEDGELIFSRFPRALLGYQTNWNFEIRPDSTSRYTESPYEYELRWSDTPYTTPSRNFGGYLTSRQLPVTCTNLTLNKPCDIYIYDATGDGEVDWHQDVFVISDPVGVLQRFRYQIRFTYSGLESVAPQAGNVIHVGTSRPFSRDDTFQFTMRAGGVDMELAKTELDRIAVLPNPYVAAAEWEPRPEVSGRGPRMVQFVRLPQECTIRIYTIRGELVRTLYHEGTGGDGAEFWDLKTEDNQDVAYGIYFYHVEAPNLGEKTGKFALIK